MKRVIFLILVSSHVLISSAQTDSIKLVKYSAGFRFTEGIYLNHQQLVDNKPIRKRMIISKYDKKDFDFYNKLFSDKKIVFFNQYGLKKEIFIDEVWGFSRRGSVFINWGDDFSRVPVIGSICHFVASVTTQEQTDLNTMYGYSSQNMPTTASRTQVNQYLMLFESGEIVEYTVANVERILRQDEVLYNEYIALKKKKKKELKFLYIRKMNEKYPLYIPIH